MSSTNLQFCICEETCVVFPRKECTSKPTWTNTEVFSIECIRNVSSLMWVIQQFDILMKEAVQHLLKVILNKFRVLHILPNSKSVILHPFDREFVSLIKVKFSNFSSYIQSNYLANSIRTEINLPSSASLRSKYFLSKNRSNHSIHDQIPQKFLNQSTISINQTKHSFKKPIEPQQSAISSVFWTLNTFWVWKN